MSIRVKFEGGPADGVVQEYPSINRALPSLYWHRDEPTELRAVYHLLGADPDPMTGLWRYAFTSQ
ncbi:hypothetical protein [Pseudonocardia sp. GCM10023141]|uniref:hypothetical protein n=1 Tax=Pseudonocardia sp. GCM10023141 TaxID=3252653 RepID=UPI00360BB27E